MYPDKQPSDASGAANLFGNLPPGVPGAGAAWTGNNTQSGTAEQVPNATDAPKLTHHLVEAAAMSYYLATQAAMARHAAMKNGASHQANNFEHIAHPNDFDYIPESNNFELPESNHFYLPHSNDLDLPHLDEFARALLEDLGGLPEDVGFAFPVQQQLDEQPQQLLQPNVQQWQPQPNEEQQQPQPNVQQQQPQQSLDAAIKRQRALNHLRQSQPSASPAPFQWDLTQLRESQQSASPAQLQQSALPAMAQPTQQQQQQPQQQSRASPFPQRPPDLHAMLEKLSIVTDNVKEVYARTCDCVGFVNLRVALGSSRQQELATFQVDHQVHQWVNHWVREEAKNPWAPILRDTPPVPSANANFNLYEFLNSYNRSFVWLYWRAMSASSGLKRILQDLPHEWIFGKGPDAVAQELRQAVIECHTLSLNTFNALLAFMEHDSNLLPYRLTDNGNFDVLSTTNQTQDQGAQTSDAIRYLTEKCHERILAQSRYVHSLLRDLWPCPVLPDLQQVQAITEDQLQMLLQQQQEVARDYPMLRVCPFAAGPNTNNDQISMLEYCVFYRLNFILQRLPRV